ncbi:MAG: heavy metal translocating P-type ATPase [Planctomyces sp.]
MSQSEQSGSCVWCGLPVVSDGVYCCTGCRIAHAITAERGQLGVVRWTVVRLGVAIFFSMNLMAFTMTMWSLDVYEVERDAFQTKLFELFRWLSLILSLPVLLLLGVPLLQSAVEAGRRRIWSTDLLIAVGVVAAYAVSVDAVLRGRERVYFEVGAAVLVMVTLGRWLEAEGRQRAVESLDQLTDLLPQRTHRLRGSELLEILSEEIAAGDVLQVFPGARFPVDGELLSDRCAVDEQIFTGESEPVEKVAGDRVLAGTVNLESLVQLGAVCGFREGSFGRLLRLLQEARLSRGYYQRMADRVSGWFLPGVGLTAVVTTALHWWRSPGEAIQAGLSVLLISCPCALGLATPLAVWTALSAAAGRQVLFRSGEAIERLARISTICFDKTGTLTTGTPRVLGLIDLCVDDSGKDSAVGTEVDLGMAGVLAGLSRHPFSVAIARWLRDFVVDSADVESSDRRLSDVQSRSGAGIRGRDASGRELRLGSATFAVYAELSEGLRLRYLQGLTEADQLATPIVLYSVDGVPRLLFMLGESLRGEAASAILDCQHLGLKCVILTGDRAGRAEGFRRELRRSLEEAAEARGLGEKPSLPEIRSGLQPGDKASAVLSIGCAGGTAMVGDGINDAPALAACDVGIAMGCGADVSRDSAQVCLLSSDLTRAPWAVLLARRAAQVIRRNLLWSFGYNTIGIVFAAAGVLNPAIAAGLMIVSSVLVIGSSLRLLSGSECGTGNLSALCRPVVRHRVSADAGGVCEMVVSHAE